TSNGVRAPVAAGSNTGAEPAAEASERRRTALVIADANGVVDLRHEDFAVADFAGTCGGEDRLDGFVGHFVAHDHFDLDLGEEVDGIFATTVKLGVALLSAVTAGLEDGHALDTCFEERIFDSIELGGLNNSFNLLHSPGYSKYPATQNIR